MKITDFRVETFAYSRGRLIGDANGVATSDLISGSILFIETDENVTGIATRCPSAAAVEKVFRAVAGEDPRSAVGLWKRMTDYVFKANSEGDDFKAIAAIDSALWDIKAKLAGEPLWRFLGATEPHVKAYGSGLDIGLSDDDVAAYYKRFADMGVDGGKLKVGPDIKRDMKRLEIVREVLSAASPEPNLLIDSNEYWSPKQAIRYISKYEEEFDLTWVEEPARRWDYRGLRKVSQGVRAAVATGENINGLDEYYPLIHNEAVDVVQLSNKGVTMSLQVANFAYGYELPVSFNSSWGNLYAHVAAAIPNYIMQEVQDFEPPACVKVDSYIDDGYIHLGTEPGFGVTVDEAKLKEMQANPAPSTVPIRAHVRREGAGLVLRRPQSGEGFYAEE